MKPREQRASQSIRTPLILRALIALTLLGVTGSIVWKSRSAVPLNTQRITGGSPLAKDNESSFEREKKSTDGPSIPHTSTTLVSVIDSDKAGDQLTAIRGAEALSTDQREIALAAIFTSWTKRDRAAAANAALSLTEPSAHEISWLAVIREWSNTEPSSLAKYARNLPSNPSRKIAVDAALSRWLETDDRSAITWIAHLNSAPENDSAVALVAFQPALVSRDPEVALDWAETIRDPAERSRAVATVIRQWRKTSPDAADRYTQNSPDLTPIQRVEILSGEHFSSFP